MQLKKGRFDIVDYRAFLCKEYNNRAKIDIVPNYFQFLSNYESGTEM